VKELAKFRHNTVRVVPRARQAVEKTVEHMLEAVNTACDGEDASEAIEATIAAELEADNVKTEVRRLAGEDMRFGVHVSLDDFLYMVTRQDRIADYAQNVAEQLAFRPLFDDEEAKENLKDMANAVAETVAKYEDAVEALRDFTISGETKAAKTKLAELIREVNLKEHEADVVEAMQQAMSSRTETMNPLQPCTCTVSYNGLTTSLTPVRRQPMPSCQSSTAERGIDSEEVRRLLIRAPSRPCQAQQWKSD